MIELNSETEKKVFDAAKNVFSKRGLKGARMQEIADEAGINKSLLHYYFRTKENLFKLVFEDSFQTLVDSILTALNSNGNFKEKVYHFTSNYIDFIKSNPYIIQFLLNTGLQDENIINLTVQKIKFRPKEKFMVEISEELKRRGITNIDPKQIIINTISLCLFPFIAKPVLLNLLDYKSEEEFNQMIEQRKKIIPEMILTYLDIKQLESKK